GLEGRSIPDLALAELAGACERTRPVQCLCRSGHHLFSQEESHPESGSPSVEHPRSEVTVRPRSPSDGSRIGECGRCCKRLSVSARVYGCYRALTPTFSHRFLGFLA